MQILMITKLAQAVIILKRKNKKISKEENLETKKEKNSKKIKNQAQEHIPLLKKNPRPQITLFRKIKKESNLSLFPLLLVNTIKILKVLKIEIRNGNLENNPEIISLKNIVILVRENIL